MSEAEAWCKDTDALERSAGGQIWARVISDHRWTQEGCMIHSGGIRAGFWSGGNFQSDS